MGVPSHKPLWLPWAVYGLLAALGVALAWLQRGQVLTAPTAGDLLGEPATALWLGLALSLLVTALTLWSTRWLVEHTRWARSLHGSLRGVSLGSSSRRLLLLALSSALAEELFFRAALLPMVGLWASSALFGALHVSSSRAALVPWMLWAALMGAVFGLLFLGSGSLLPPLLAHAAINYGNMRYLCGEPEPSLARATSTFFRFSSGSTRRASSARVRARARVSTRIRIHGERWRRL